MGESGGCNLSCQSLEQVVWPTNEYFYGSDIRKDACFGIS